MIDRGINARVAGLFDVDLGPGKVPLMEVPTLPDEDLVRMRRIGFDLVRLPLNWSAIEPTDTDPPTYDAAYLDRVVAFVAAARRADVRVLLDFHQDAYSKYVGQDGAPLWAIQPPPDKLLEGPLTDLSARITSTQVQRAYVTFFDRGEPDRRQAARAVRGHGRGGRPEGRGRRDRDRHRSLTTSPWRARRSCVRSTSRWAPRSARSTRAG